MTTSRHEGLASVQDRVADAVATANRHPDAVELVAVSKTFAADHIRPVIDAGQKVFGENRVQEAQGKWPGLTSDYDGLSVHLIGPLQTNKVKDAVALFDCIETVDRPKLAVALAGSWNVRENHYRCSFRSIPARRIKRQVHSLKTPMRLSVIAATTLDSRLAD